MNSRQTFDIVCTVENLLHCVNCWKLTALCVLWKTCDSVVFNVPWKTCDSVIFNVLWKTCDFVVFVNINLMINFLWNTCNIVVFVNMNLMINVLWKTDCTVCTVENLLHCVYCGQTYCHRTFRRHDISIVCTIKILLWKTYWHHRVSYTVENLLTSSCIMYRGKFTDIIVYHVLWKTYWHHCVSCTVENLLTSSCIMYRGKFTDIIVCHVPWKTYSHNTLRQHTFDIIMYCENLTV